MGWEGQLWEFDCLRNGLALASRKSTELLQPLFLPLEVRDRGHVYLDLLQLWITVSRLLFAYMTNATADTARALFRGPSDKKQKSLKIGGSEGFFFKPTIKMVQSGTYLDIISGLTFQLLF